MIRGCIKGEQETYRRECEAREWIKRGYTTDFLVTDLMKDIKKKRGQKAADELREEMRKQWRARR